MLTRIPTRRAGVMMVAWLGLVVFLLLRSWVCEDAYITFRVIDNFLHGYGLRWNVVERVQVYTHPLWLLLHLPLVSLVPNLFFLNIALSLICSGLAVAILLRTFSHLSAPILLVGILSLLLSRAFVDYAGSGLETSLSFLLFALLGWCLLHARARQDFMFWLSLSSSLLLLNRLDHVLLIAPVWACLLWHMPASFQGWRARTMLVLGALPLVAWMGFSLWYYGSFFPNTKYAKLDTGLPLLEYISQGLQYLFIWLVQDTASVLTVGAGLFLACASRIIPLSIEVWLMRSVALGIALTLLYTIRIGGDYMMGRFFAVPFFASVWLLLACMPKHVPMDRLFAGAMALLLAFAISWVVRDVRTSCEGCVPMKGKVLDARQIFHRNSLFKKNWPPEIRHAGEYKFREAGEKIAADTGAPVRALTYVGMQGYYAGPERVIIDELALCDPLLARLPARGDRPFHVGHYRRRLPRGYLEARRTGNLEMMPPSLAYYYTKIQLITQGDLWDTARLETILRFQFGQYDRYVQEFVEQP